MTVILKMIISFVLLITLFGGGVKIITVNLKKNKKTVALLLQCFGQAMLGINLMLPLVEGKIFSPSPSVKFFVGGVVVVVAAISICMTYEKEGIHHSKNECAGKNSPSSEVPAEQSDNFFCYRKILILTCVSMILIPISMFFIYYFL